MIKKYMQEIEDYENRLRNSQKNEQLDYARVMALKYMAETKIRPINLTRAESDIWELFNILIHKDK